MRLALFIFLLFQAILSIASASGLTCAQAFNSKIDIARTTSYPDSLMLVPENHPALRMAAHSLTQDEIKSPSFQTFLAKLKTLHHQKRGLGLAAPQTGVPVKVAIVRMTYSPWLTLIPRPRNDLVLINPEIISLNSKMRKGLENCMSLGAACDIVSRSKQIKVKYLDENGSAHVQVFSDFTSVIIQHEVDHLNGILLTDVGQKRLKEFDVKNADVLETSERVSLLNYISSLTPEQQKAFASYAHKINRDLYLINEPDSLPNSFFEISHYKTTSDVFRDLFLYYQIRIKTPHNLKAYQAWIKSELHAAFVLEDLYTSTDPTLKPVLSELRANNPFFKYLTLTGIRGPPFGDIREVFVPVSRSIDNITKSFKFSTANEALAFSRAISDWGIVWKNQQFELTIRGKGKSQTIKVNSSTELLQLFRANLQDNEDVANPSFLSIPRYSLNGQRSKRITFGLEAEFVPALNSLIQKDYRPSNYSEERWIALSSQDQYQKSIEHINNSKKSALFVKNSSAPAWTPEKLYGESDGNFEFNGLIFSSIQNVKEFVQNLELRYGKPSYQGHVVFPRENNISGLTGYSVFEADLAQLKTLERNYGIYLEHPNFDLAKNLFHHSLGPLGEADRIKLARAEARIRKGKSTNLNSTQKTYAPVLRTNIYADGLIGFELRQFHNRSSELLDSMEQLSIELETRGQLEAFKDFANTPLIQKSQAIKKFSDLGYANMTDQLNSLMSGLTWYIQTKFSFVTIGGQFPAGERILLPFRPWEDHPVIQKLPPDRQAEAKQRISMATKLFSNNLSALLTETTSVDESVALRLRLLIAKWAHEAQLSKFFYEYKEKVLFSNPSPTLDELLTRYQKIENPSSNVEFLPDLPLKKDKSAESVTTIRYMTGKDSTYQQSTEYKLFIQNSVEIIYSSAMPYGHIMLRVGDRLYAFNYIEKTVRDNFEGMKASANRIGFVFHVPYEQIVASQSQIDRFYNNAVSYNLLGFDAASGELAVFEKIKSGNYVGLKLKSDHWLFSNNNLATGFIINKGDQLYVETPDGLRHEAYENDRGICIHSLSCATSATYVLKKFFGISLGDSHGAKSLRDSLLKNTLARPPDVIIFYH